MKLSVLLNMHHGTKVSLYIANILYKFDKIIN